MVPSSSVAHAGASGAASDQQQVLEHQFLGAAPRPISSRDVSNAQRSFFTVFQLPRGDVFTRFFCKPGEDLPLEVCGGHVGNSPQTRQLHDVQGALGRAHASGLRGSRISKTMFGASPPRMLSLFVGRPRPCSCPALNLRSGLFAQAESDDVVKWLIWAQADPQKRPGNAKLPQDSGQTTWDGGRETTTRAWDSGGRQGRHRGP